MKIPKPFESYAKTIAIMLVVLLNSVGLMGVGDTVGFYFDAEEASNNTFLAGNVDFTATSTEWSPLTVAVSMAPGDFTFQDFTIDPQTSNPFHYYATSTVSGDQVFCDGVTVSLEQNANVLYSGALSELTTGTTTSTSTLALGATTGITSFQNSICDVTLDFIGWQTRHGFSTLGGFNDIETVNTTLASWGFRINKVYADVHPDRYADGTTTEGENEWVEIYNQTDVPLDLSGWEICDNSSCDTVPAGTPLIPAMGFGVITNHAGVFSATGTAPWYLPAGVVEIPLGSTIGNGLANTADMLQLKRPDGVVIDQMNWGTATSTWTNYTSDLWVPGVLPAAEGNLLARVPNGYDTDQESDWKEIIPPAVDLIYPDETGSYTWYWGHSYTITWTATNPNGSDDDLNISLFYIKDLDHSGTITDLDTTHIIAQTTANDGAYTWTLPSGFLGYIWVKLVATGPENPLNNSSTVSGMIWDPAPIFVGPQGVDPSALEDIDTEAPVITLNGNNPAIIVQGTNFIDPGAVVTDNVNNNLGYTVEGEVDTEVLGEYTLTYTAVDQAGNVSTATRVVVVYDPALGEPDLSAFETEDQEEVAEDIPDEEEVVPAEEGSSEETNEQVGGGAGTGTENASSADETTEESAETEEVAEEVEEEVPTEEVEEVIQEEEVNEGENIEESEENEDAQEESAEEATEEREESEEEEVVEMAEEVDETEEGDEASEEAVENENNEEGAESEGESATEDTEEEMVLFREEEDDNITDPVVEEIVVAQEEVQEEPLEEDENKEESSETETPVADTEDETVDVVQAEEVNV